MSRRELRSSTNSENSTSETEKSQRGSLKINYTTPSRNAKDNCESKISKYLIFVFFCFNIQIKQN